MAGQNIKVERVTLEGQEGQTLEGYELTFPSRDGKTLVIMFHGPEGRFEESRFEAYFMSLPGAEAPTTPAVEAEPQAAEPETDKTEGK